MTAAERRVFVHGAVRVRSSVRGGGGGGGCETSCLIHGGSGLTNGATRTSGVRLNKRKKENGNLCKLKSHSSFASPLSIPMQTAEDHLLCGNFGAAASRLPHTAPHRARSWPPACVSNCEGERGPTDRPTHISWDAGGVRVASVAR